MLLAGSFTDLCLPSILIQPRTKCQGMALPTVTWVFLYQLRNKTVSHRHAHNPIRSGRSLSWDSGDSTLCLAGSLRKSMSCYNTGIYNTELTCVASIAGGCEETQNTSLHHKSIPQAFSTPQYLSHWGWFSNKWIFRYTDPLTSISGSSNQLSENLEKCYKEAMKILLLFEP